MGLYKYIIMKNTLSQKIKFSGKEAGLSVPKGTYDLLVYSMTEEYSTHREQPMISQNTYADSVDLSGMENSIYVVTSVTATGKFISTKVAL